MFRRFIALLLLIGASSYAEVPSIVIPENYWVAIVPFTDLCPDTTTTTLPTAMPPSVSTGPVIMKSRSSDDCYRIDYINPNGSVPAPSWVNCP